MAIRGWLYIGDSSAMFISEDPKRSISEFAWNSIVKENRVADFLGSFKILKEDHRPGYKSYLVDLEETGLRNWFSSALQ